LGLKQTLNSLLQIQQILLWRQRALGEGIFVGAELAVLKVTMVKQGKEIFFFNVLAMAK
jgi:hypothetical protein